MSRIYGKARASSFLFLFVCIGCSTMNVTPELATLDKAEVLVKGPIQYDGKSEYLPRTISEGSISEYGLTFRYATTETQERSGWDIVALFNPLTILGTPTGSLTSTVTGKLEVSKGAELVKSYIARCTQTASKGIYYGETFSELRRKGLLAVKENIETQMSRDQEFLAKVGSKAFLQEAEGIGSLNR